MIGNEMNRAARLRQPADHDPAAHAAAFRSLLLFTPEAARQIPHVLAGR